MVSKRDGVLRPAAIAGSLALFFAFSAYPQSGNIPANGASYKSKSRAEEMKAEAKGVKIASILRQMNGEVLQAHARALQTPAGAHGLGDLLKRRSDALGQLIRIDPKEALKYAFDERTANRLRAAFPDDDQFIEQQGVWRGKLEVAFIDFSDGSYRELRRLVTSDGTFELISAEQTPVSAKCDDEVIASGFMGSGVIVAGETTVAPSDAPTACPNSGQQNVAVLLVTFPGVAPPSTVTPSGVYQAFFGATGRSLDNYWREASYGKTWAAGNVYGWYTLDRQFGCFEMNLMRDNAIQKASAAVNFSTVNRLYVVYPEMGCGAGFAGSSCQILSSPSGSFSATSAYLEAGWLADRDQAVYLAAHEGGHMMGLAHSGTLDYGSEVIGPVGSAGATADSGDWFSTMGAWVVGHYASPHKYALNWLDLDLAYRTVETTGTYSVQPLSGNTTGLKALRIRRGTANNEWLWLEYRQPVGQFDNSLYTQVYSGALLRFEDSATGARSILLDYTPQNDDWSDAALVAGSSWKDPYSDLTIAVTSATTTALTVALSYGGGTSCVTSAPTVTISPANPSAQAGSSVNYTVSITNKDSSGCSPTTYSLSSQLPSSWPTAYSSSSLSLSPGQTGTVTMTKTVPAGTAPATYGVDAAASNGARQGTGAANCTVTAPQKLKAAVLLPAATFRARDSVDVGAKVLIGDSPVSGASVEIAITKPDGKVTTNKRLTSDSGGIAAWTYRLGPKDPPGLYSVSAKASYASDAATSDPVTFTVQ